MTNEELKKAFMEDTPVRYRVCMPSSNVVFDAKRIDAIYYRKSRANESEGGVIVCAEIITQDNTVVKVPAKNVLFR
jgi:hypothetical protein